MADDEVEVKPQGVQLGLLAECLAGYCRLTKTGLADDSTPSQVSYYLSTLKEKLLRVESAEAAVAGSTGVADQDTCRADVKKRAQNLIFRCLALADSQPVVPTDPVWSDLPKIALPKFSGEFSMWENYLGLFAALVHNKKTLSNIVKFHYLLLSLVNEPKELTQGLQTTSENYEIAVSTVKEL